MVGYDVAACSRTRDQDHGEAHDAPRPPTVPWCPTARFRMRGPQSKT